MTELSLADSHARLGWVRVLISRVEPIVGAINEQARRGDIAVETATDGDFGYARFTLVHPIPIPDEIGFTVADIAVNARSCLDMAITTIMNAHAPGALRNPYFPIEDDVVNAKTNGSLGQLRKALPPPFVHVLEELQPRYDTPWGRSDVPINRSALMIREISNANKHRNVTPTVRTVTSSGFTAVVGLHIEHVPTGSRSPLPDNGSSMLEIRYRPAATPPPRLEDIRPWGNMELMLHKSQFSYADLDFHMPISVAEFLDLAPKYVEHALRVLQQAHDQTQNPQRTFIPDRSIAL